MHNQNHGVCRCQVKKTNLSPIKKHDAYEIGRFIKKRFLSPLRRQTQQNNNVDSRWRLQRLPHEAARVIAHTVAQSISVHL